MIRTSQRKYIHSLKATLSQNMGMMTKLKGLLGINLRRGFGYIKNSTDDSF